MVTSLTRSQVLGYRVRAQQLDRDSGELGDTAILDIGVQETGPDGARWALANRGVDVSGISDDELVMAWTIRGAPHVYRRENLPSIAAHDGGRPWVAFDISAASAATGIDLNELLQDARNADPTSTLRLLAAKRLFHEIGTSTIAGQRVVGLTGSFTPANLPSSGLISAKLQAQLKAKLTQLGATREDVTTYLAYSGEPVRIVTTLVTAAHGSITSTVNVHGINIPVVVAAPPAAQTISLAQLKKLPPSA